MDNNREDSQLVCEKNMCSACGSCIQICPQQCISYASNEHETISTVIDKTKCIGCNLCTKACPQISHCVGNVPVACYAAWSSDEIIRHNSASGGVAAEFYRLFAEKGAYFAGVSLDSNHTATYKLYHGIEQYTAFQNSKYVYSSTENVYEEIATVAKAGNEVLFVGLPCQVAGLKKHLEAMYIDTSNILFIDIVCHGTTPNEFLNEHISYLEKKLGKHATEVFFRDPSQGTFTFTFSLKERGQIFYQKKVHRNDPYQIGYHYGITYRDNCYQCRFAQPARIGDITLADFSGLGKIATCDFPKRKVSCVLINTAKGKGAFQKLVAENKLVAKERPLDEALKYETQLIHPTSAPENRKMFFNEYEKTQDFEKAMTLAAKKIIFKNEAKHFFCIEKVHQIISKTVPTSVKKKIKAFLKR